MRSFLFFLFCSLVLTEAQSQLRLQAFVYESAMRQDYLNEVAVFLMPRTSLEDTLALAYTNREGQAFLELPEELRKQPHDYHIGMVKAGFKSLFVALPPIAQGDTLLYLKAPITRLPGYRLELSIMAEGSEDLEGEDGLGGALIEVYNRTMQREELRLVNHPYPFLNVQLEQGNEYVFLIRKKGYYSKRMRANVNINGCILCMEGFGTVNPGVTDNLSQDLSMGTLLGSVSLKPLVLNETMQLENIYYDLGKAELRADALPALDKLAKLMRDNPQIRLELSSHTDSRGAADKNLALSQQRADNVLAYLKNRHKIETSRIIAKGYGERRLLNSCKDGQSCSEELHQQNRRTEITVVDIAAEDAESERSLASIMQEEDMDELLGASEDSYFVQEEKPEPNRKVETISPPKTIALGYTGYKIELLCQGGAPDMSHPILRRFEQLFLDLNKEQAYCFLFGDFKTKAEAKAALESIKTEYPQARIQQYKDGIRH